MGDGIIKVTGDCGVGKTLLCYKLMKLFPKDYHTLYIFNPDMTADEVNKLIADDLGVTGRTSYELLQKIRKHLDDTFEQGKRYILLVDEARKAIFRGVGVI